VGRVRPIVNREFGPVTKSGQDGGHAKRARTIVAEVPTYSGNGPSYRLSPAPSRSVGMSAEMSALNAPRSLTIIVCLRALPAQERGTRRATPSLGEWNLMPTSTDTTLVLRCPYFLVGIERKPMISYGDGRFTRKIIHSSAIKSAQSTTTLTLLRSPNATDGKPTARSKFLDVVRFSHRPCAESIPGCSRPGHRNEHHNSAIPQSPPFRRSDASS
jgi:hypothetical protein